MKLLLSILATIAVWTAPSIGQPNPNPSTSSSSKASPPKSTLPVNPPNTGDTAVSTKVNPQKTSPGVGIFNAASNNPWGVPPPNQPPMPQVYQPWGVRPQLTPSWGPQPPPVQRMPLLMDIASMMDLLDIPCGISQRRRRLMMGAVDNSEPFCECRIGGCDGAMPDLSGNSDCPGATVCCCTGTPYNNFASATVMQSNLHRARSFGLMPGGMHGGMPAGMHGGMPAGVHGGMPAGMHGGMSAGVHGGMPAGVPGYVPAGVPGSLPGRMPAASMPNRMAGNVQSGIPAGRQGPFMPRRAAASNTYHDFLNMWYRK